MDRIILLVDDEPPILRALTRVLRPHYQVLATTNIQQALNWLDEYPIGVVLSDYRMPDINGVQFLSKVKKHSPQVQRILLSGQADFEIVSASIDSHACHRFLAKPWDDEQLRCHIEGAFHSYSQRAQTNIEDKSINLETLADDYNLGRVQLLYRLLENREEPDYFVEYCLASPVYPESDELVPVRLTATDQDTMRLEAIAKWAKASAEMQLTLDFGKYAKKITLSPDWNLQRKQPLWLSYRALKPVLAHHLRATLTGEELTP